MMQFKHILGPAIPISEARIWRMARTRAFYLYEFAFALIAALSHPYAPLHAAPIPTQILYWVVGQVSFLFVYHFLHVAWLRLSLRFGIKTISETLLMASTLTILFPTTLVLFPYIGVEVTSVDAVVPLFLFFFVLFEIGAFWYLSFGDRALFPEIYGPETTAPVDPERYQLFLNGTDIPLVQVEMIRAHDRGIEVAGRGRTVIVQRAFHATVAELPVDLGIQIHRAIWVSRKIAKTNLEEEGTLFVATSDGKRYPVARSRKAEFRTWLRMTS